MLVNYIRSSSYNDYDFCQKKYLLSYDLGLPSHSNKAAERGSIVHKCLEILATKQFNKQESIDVVKDDETGYKMDTESVMPFDVLKFVYSWYTTKSFFDWDDSDHKECTRLLKLALENWNGVFNPANQKIVCPEQHFDIELRKPCFAYSYPNGDSGFLRIKGTLDLIIEQEDGTWEIVDYKTGARKCWTTGDVKDYKKLQKDAQLLIYYYAARKLFPEVKKWSITILYVKDGGPFTLAFGDEEFKLAEKMLQKRFLEIKNNYKPRGIYPSFKCSRFCWFGMRNEKDEKVEYKDSTCAKISNELLTLGLPAVESKYRKGEVAYTGGGRSDVQDKKD